MSAGERLNVMLTEAGLEPLDARRTAQFGQYFDLLERWNCKTNLTSLRDRDGILRHHFVESIACARLLPSEVRTLLDVGSGAGFPGIPIALCRPEIAVTLAESQNKKATFLREVVRTLGLSVQVHAARAESITSRFDCVILRAVDRMQLVIAMGAGLVKAGGWLALLTTKAARIGQEESAGPGFSWQQPISMPYGLHRVFAMGRRTG